MSNYPLRLKHIRVPRLEHVGAFLQVALRRAKSFRLSPLDLALLGGLALLAAYALVFLLLCSFAPVVGDLAAKQD